MIETNDKPSRSGRPRRIAAAVAIGVCLFGQLGAIGLVGPDEPRYVWIARAMAQTGDWITPRLYGQPWFEKPVLYYWAAAVGFLLHLPAEWAARLPSALAALAAACAIGWLARKHYGTGLGLLENPGVLSPLVFSTSVAAIGFARSAGPDMLFSACLALAMTSAACALRRKGALRSDQLRLQDDSLPLLLLGVFLGLGVLAKGPAALVLAGGAIFFWALGTKQWRAAMRLSHPLAIGAFVVVALPWYLLCALRNPDFFRVFLLEHNFQRYLTPEFHHPQPFWFFLPIVLVALLPWTVLLWPATQQAARLWRERSWHSSPGFFFACWAIFPVLFFSFSQSKLPGYILPSIPPFALLLAAALKRVAGADVPERPRNLKLIGIALGSTWIALALAALLWAHRLPQTARDAAGRDVFAAAGVAVAGGLAVTVLAMLGKRGSAALTALLAVLCVEIAGVLILPPLGASFSARPHAQLLRNDAHPDRIFSYRLPRSWNFGLHFYMGRELSEWSSSDPNAALVLTTPDGLREIQRLGRVHGELNESFQGIVYVSVAPAPR